MLDESARQSLLRLARESLHAGVSLGVPGPFPQREYPAPLQEWRSSFVTLSRVGHLRGCCGRLEADRPLTEDVWENAYASGFRDPRFEPLLAHECEDLHIAISVLSPLEKLEVHGTDELLDSLIPQRHGLLLARGEERVTFIPHVWESVSDAPSFLRHLREKAGWPPEGWEPDLEVWRFEAESF
jgi:AmmeMemoRadiSam system protein A